MKKIVCLLLVCTLTLCLFACTDPNESSVTTTQPTPGTEDILTKGEGVMTWEQYNAAALDTEVVIEGYIQAKQAWWAKEGVGRGTFYLQDGVGGYLLYEMLCTEEEYNQLTIGTKIRVTGYKSQWKGEVEVIDATYEILEGNYVAKAVDVTDKLGTSEIVNYQNMFVSFKGLTVVSISYQGGEPGKDIYVTLSYNGNNYDFCVESYLTPQGSAVYTAVGALKEGDVIDVEGFAYWYDDENRAEVYPENINTHITNVTVK